MLLNKPIPAAYILNKVKMDLIYVLIVSLFVLFITEKYKEFLPEMPLTIPAFIGTAISILLSFKLNQSYDRWWEARKIWGLLVNYSRVWEREVRILIDKNDRQRMPHLPILSIQFPQDSRSNTALITLLNLHVDWA